jgi:hypothetical protein
MCCILFANPFVLQVATVMQHLFYTSEIRPGSVVCCILLMMQQMLANPCSTGYDYGILYLAFFIVVFLVLFSRCAFQQCHVYLLKKYQLRCHHHRIQLWTLDPCLVPCLPQARIEHPSKASQSDCVATILDLLASLHKLSNLLIEMDHEQLTRKEELHDWSTNWKTRTCTLGLFSSPPEAIIPLRTIS